MFAAVDVLFCLSLSLYLFLSGAGEMQTMQWFAFLLVFLRPGHALSLRPVLLQRHLPQGHRPACVFKFFSQVDDVVGVSVADSVVFLVSFFFVWVASLRKFSGANF